MYAFAMNMRIFLLSLLLSLTAISSSALEPAATAATAEASLSGMVVKDPGGEPLKRVLVQVVSEDQQNRNYTGLTGGDGHFAIGDIEPGRYRVFLEKTGFLEANNRHWRSAGEAISLNAGQQVNEFMLHMMAAAAISGRVVDEDGDPVANVEVAALRNGYVNGQRQLSPERSEHSNDRGEYRIAGLAPGHYYLVAAASPEFFSRGQKEFSDPAKPGLGYVPTYYPGVVDSSQAAALELHSGDEMPINFTLIAVDTFHVRGTALDLPDRRGIAAGDSQAAVMLFSKRLGTMLSAAEVDKQGRFDIAGVAPGSYVLTFTTADPETPNLGRQTVEVNNADVNGIRIVPMSLGKIQGRARVETGAAEDLKRLTVVLQAIDDDAYGVMSGLAEADWGRIKEDGSFELKNVPAGNYWLSVRGAAHDGRDYYVEKILMSGRNASDTPLTVSGGTLNVDLVLSLGTGSVKGTVVDGKSEPVKQATVVALPEKQKRGRHDLYYIVQSDQYGRFILHGLRPGRYTLLSWDDVEDGAYFDPDFINVYEPQGKMVEITPHLVEQVALPVQSGNRE